MKANHVNHVEVCRSIDFLSSETMIFFSDTSSVQWYQANTTQPHARLCAECWTYYKKLGGLKYPKKSGKK